MHTHLPDITFHIWLQPELPLWASAGLTKTLKPLQGFLMGSPGSSPAGPVVTQEQQPAAGGAKAPPQAPICPSYEGHCPLPKELHGTLKASQLPTRRWRHLRVWPVPHRHRFRKRHRLPGKQTQRWWWGRGTAGLCKAIPQVLRRAPHRNHAWAQNTLLLALSSRLPATDTCRPPQSGRGILQVPWAPAYPQSQPLDIAACGGSTWHQHGQRQQGKQRHVSF